MTSQVLFDSSATRYFVSLLFSNKFSDDPGTLDYPLDVENVDKHSVSASKVHRGFVFNMLKGRYLTDLVLIPLRGLTVILGIDMLGSNGDIIDCEH